MEQTFVILKPDAVERGLIGEIIARIERKNMQITRMEMTTLEKEVVEEHYAHLKDLPFFGKIVEFMTRGPVVLLIVQGEAAIGEIRRMAGATNFEKADFGTIRGDFATSVQENLIHTSDAPETAEGEIKRFFG